MEPVDIAKRFYTEHGKEPWRGYGANVAQVFLGLSQTLSRDSGTSETFDVAAHTSIGVPWGRGGGGLLGPFPWQGILYTGGRGWYRMCSRQPTVGVVVSKIKQNNFFCTNSHFLSGLTTPQAVDPLPLCRDLPADTQHFFN
jgi:hypothetical protein